LGPGADSLDHNDQVFAGWPVVPHSLLVCMALEHHRLCAQDLSRLDGAGYESLNATDSIDAAHFQIPGELMK
jgi:hypothetical protein